jgi:hypothetical protein
MTSIRGLIVLDDELETELQSVGYRIPDFQFDPLGASRQTIHAIAEPKLPQFKVRGARHLPTSHLQQSAKCWL